MNKLSLVLLTVVLFVVFVTGDIVNTRAKREVDLQTQLARHIVSVDIVNKGTQPVTTYDVAVPKNLEKYVAAVAAYIPDEDKKDDDDDDDEDEDEKEEEEENLGTPLVVARTPTFDKDGFIICFFSSQYI